MTYLECRPSFQEQNDLPSRPGQPCRGREGRWESDERQRVYHLRKPIPFPGMQPPDRRGFGRGCQPNSRRAADYRPRYRGKWIYVFVLPDDNYTLGGKWIYVFVLPDDNYTLGGKKIYMFMLPYNNYTLYRIVGQWKSSSSAKGSAGSF